MGYIQSWFVNFWNTNKPSANTETNADTEVANKGLAIYKTYTIG